MRINIDGIEAEYLYIGTGPDFLILHGWGRGITDWRRMADLLGKHFRVWVIDLPGFGKSKNPPETWDLSEYVKFVDRFIHAQGISHLILLGHSFGGRIAIELASTHPAYLEKLILVDSAGIKLPVKFIVKLLRAIVKVGRFFVRLAPKKFADKVEYYFFKGLAKRGVEYAQYPPLREVFKRVVEKDLEPFLERVNVPTLLIWGENDKIIPLSVAKTLHSKIRHATLKVIPGASHFSYFEKEAEFLKIIKDYLRVKPA